MMLAHLRCQISPISVPQLQSHFHLDQVVAPDVTRSSPNATKMIYHRLQRLSKYKDSPKPHQFPRMTQHRLKPDLCHLASSKLSRIRWDCIKYFPIDLHMTLMTVFHSTTFANHLSYSYLPHHYLTYI